MLVPLLATALGGFKDLGELRANPLGLPQHWVWSNYWDILASARYWRVLGNSLLIALLDRGAHAGAVVDGGLRLRPSQVLRRQVSAQLSAARPAVSGRDRDPAAVHQDPRSRPARFLLGRRPAAGRLLAGDGRSAAAQRLPAIAERTARRGDDGWLRLLPLFPLHHAAAVGADPVDGRGHLVRRRVGTATSCRSSCSTASRAIPGRSA